MKIKLIAECNRNGSAVMRFEPENSDDRAVLSEAIHKAKEKEIDGPYALSKFLLDIGDRREFKFIVEV